MTQEEYQKQRWGMYVKVEYCGQAYDVGALHYPEYLLGLVFPGSHDYMWVRCESVNLVCAGIDAYRDYEKKMRG